MIHEPIAELTQNAIRFLAVDAVEKAKSGHPGTPMELAVVAYVLWMKHMRYSPSNPDWANRDRFVLSVGHASMLLYSMLYLTGYDVSIDDLQHFRQLGSRTPGHPERGCLPGVETTTGPLGQGFGTGVGMAIAEKYLQSYFNREGNPILDYRIYALCSDGDMMEGVSSEAASLAGHLGLDNLIYIYSANRISIEGSTDLAFTEDVGKRFEAYGWYVQHVDGNDAGEIDSALTAAEEEKDRPSLIIARTHIGYGSPNKQDTKEAHGDPLGTEETKLTKQNLGWPLEPTFYFPEEVLLHTREALDRGSEFFSGWEASFERYKDSEPSLAAEFSMGMAGSLPPIWKDGPPIVGSPGESVATREASSSVINALARQFPLLIGGSADLAPSTRTLIDGGGDFERKHPGRNLHFGVREHAMGAALNGMALTRPIITFGATFLIFSDFMRPAIRLAALMGLGVIYVFTHDSVFLGEDGPTHQPIEHLASLRAIPNLHVIRPADALEVPFAWQAAIEHRTGPTALLLTRQKLPVLKRESEASPEMLLKGGYVIRESGADDTDIVLIATGSEVHIAIQGAELLAKEGLNVSVVNIPSWEIFDAQTAEYRDKVIPPAVPARLAIEAGSPQGWERYVGDQGEVLGISRFGASAPYKDLLEFFGFTPENIAKKGRELFARTHSKGRQ